MMRLTSPRKSHEKSAENVSAILSAIAAACNAYAKWVEWQLATHKETTTNALEDEMDRLAADGSPAAKLRLERLQPRLARIRASKP